MDWTIVPVELQPLWNEKYVVTSVTEEKIYIINLIRI